MSGHVEISYQGWSSFVVRGGTTAFAFDPVYRPLHGASWATLDDFGDVQLVCLTHGHPDHSLDAAPVARSSGATVAAPDALCRRLRREGIPGDKLVSLEPGRTVELCGLTVTAFEWYHRNINFWHFFRGSPATLVEFVYKGVFRSAFRAPKFGYMVSGPDGLSVMNYGEGFSDLMCLEETKAIGQKYKPRVLLAGMQLHFEKNVADGVAAVAPEKVVLYHPHEQLFRKVKLSSSPPQVFAERVKAKCPEVDVCLVNPRDTVTVG